MKNGRQKLFYIGRLPQKQEKFDFIAKMSDVLDRHPLKSSRQQELGLITSPDSEDVVFAETERTAPN